MSDEPLGQRPTGSRGERIAEAIQQEIAAQGLEGGARLGLRTELITRFQASSSSMDEALRLLRERGLIAVRPGPTGGVFVETKPAQLRLGAIDVWFSGTVRDPRALFDARLFFDDAFAALAVTRATPQDIRAMSWALDEMRAASTDAAAYLDASMRFHLAAARASRVTVAVSLYEMIIALLRNSMLQASFVEPRDERVYHSVEIHEGMLQAITDGDADRMAKLVNLHGSDMQRLDD